MRKGVVKIMFKQAIKPIYYTLIKVIPRNNFGDKIFSLIHFYITFRQLPNQKKLLRNYLFKLKHSYEGYNPLRAYITDKAFVKDYVKAKIGDVYNVPTIKVLSSLDEAKDFNFPQRCCIKPTHLSGAVILRENDEKIDFSVIEKWFITNRYELTRQKHLRYLKPKLIVEPLIFNTTKNLDYKFFCYKGKAKFLQIDIDRRSNHTRLYYDRDWNKQGFSIIHPMSSKNIDKPVNFELMLSVADKLSRDFEFIRVDLYTNGKKIYLGELSNFPENGNAYFVPREAEEIGSKLLFNET